MSNDVLAERLANSDAVLAAMLRQALVDATAGRHKALVWLQSEQAAEIASLLDVSEALALWLAEAGGDAASHTITTQQAAAMLDRSRSATSWRARRLRVGIIRNGRRWFSREDVERMRADVRTRGGLR